MTTGAYNFDRLDDNGAGWSAQNVSGMRAYLAFLKKSYPEVFLKLKWEAVRGGTARMGGSTGQAGPWVQENEK